METIRHIISLPGEIVNAIRSLPQTARDLVPAYTTLLWMVCGFGMMIEGEISKWLWRLGLITVAACVVMGLC
jgi:hypothetical protein